MPYLTVTIDHVVVDGGQPEPVWHAYSDGDPDPVDTWCLMYRAGKFCRLASVRGQRNFFLETWAVAEEFEDAVAYFMAHTLGASRSLTGGISHAA